MKTTTPFWIIFSHGNHKNHPLTIPVFSHGDLMTSFLLVSVLWELLFFLLFSLYFLWRPFYIMPRSQLCHPWLFIFAPFCSRLSLAWIALPCGAVWWLNLISKINITNIYVYCPRKPETGKCGVFFFMAMRGFVSLINRGKKTRTIRVRFNLRNSN